MKLLILGNFFLFFATSLYAARTLEPMTLKCSLLPTFYNNITKEYETNQDPSMKSKFTSHTTSKRLMATINHRVGSFTIKAEALDNTMTSISVEEETSGVFASYSTPKLVSDFSKATPAIFLKLKNNQKNVEQSLTQERVFVDASLVCLIVYK